jgi:dTMP kinase
MFGFRLGHVGGFDKRFRTLKMQSNQKESDPQPMVMRCLHPDAILSTFQNMHLEQHHPMFITFEGLDFSGKSTQVGLFADALSRSGAKTLVLRDPGGTAIGEKIRAVLLDRELVDMSDFTELFLFSASRSQLVQEVIKPALEHGTIVVCDRFYDSTTAYQGWGRRLSLEAIKAVNQVAADGLVPAITYFIDIPVPEIELRMMRQNAGADRMEMSGRAFYERVQEGFLQLAKEEPRFEVIDGRMSIEEIRQKVWARFQQELTNRIKSV